MKEEERFRTFTFLINSISRDIRRIKSDEMSKLNLKSPHVSCLYYLYNEQSLTAKELCEICGEDKASISRSLDYLIANGYIQNDNFAKRHYKNPIQLTEMGRKVGSILSERIDNILSEVAIGMTEEERKILYKSLSLIHDNLQKLSK